MRLAESVTFGGSGFDRAAELREFPDRIRALLDGPETGILPIWRGKPLVRAGETAAELVWVAPGHPMLDQGTPPLLLGRSGAGAGRFAVDISAWEPETLPADYGAFFDRSEVRHPHAPEGAAFLELRSVMVRVSAEDAELGAMAKALLEWHRRHRFCANCGHQSDPSGGGWWRDCPSCGARHFPRTDPVVIMLVTSGDDVLLGRSHGWPEGFYSLLAGFIEPGETVEAAVRREVREEAGVKVGPVRYLASQPWPFPASLMLGCIGRATSREIRVDPVELDDARWLSREEVAETFAGTHPSILPARPGAIAHFLLRNWLADTLD